MYTNMTLTIAVLSLIISGLTFWLTRIRKGSLKMTRPSIICFLGRNGNDTPKVFIRTLLYSTSDQGQYLQNMFVRLHTTEAIYNFNIWAYQEDKMIRGSGLFVSKNGNSANHHFFLPKNESWNFIDGNYILEVFVETVNNSPKKIFEYKISLSIEQSNALTQNKGVYFDWESNTGQYISSISEEENTNTLNSKKKVNIL